MTFPSLGGAGIASLVSNAASSSLAAIAGNLQQLLGNITLQQTARLIRLEGTPVPVLVEQFYGQESLDQLFEFEVDVICEIAALASDTWLGQEVKLTIIDPSGAPVVRYGQIAAMSDSGSDGGFNRYRLTLLPWAAWLTARQDCWVFQDRTVIDIATEVLGDYKRANWRHDVTQTLRQRSLCIQYQESDWAFLTRLFAEEGLSYVFEHPAGAGSTSGGSACCLHIFDSEAQLDKCSASPISFGSVKASLSDDRLTRFEAHLRSRTRVVSRSSWDYQALHAPSGNHESSHDAGAQGDWEEYDGSGAYQYKDGDHADRHAEQRQLAHDGHAERFEAEGAVRALRPAQTFTLIDHADYSGQQFVVRRIMHHGANNLSAQVKDLLRSSSIENGSYRQIIECQSADRPLVPDLLPKPSAQQQSALVVGLGDSPITSDRDHRIKIQFAWQRGAQPNPGGLNHPAGSNANQTEQGFTWVRVAEWLAGPNWGSQFTPRVGDEVLVDFVESDIDRPLIVGSLHSDAAPPPFSAGYDGPANHAGHISGYHGMSLDGSDYTRWLMDDTPDQLRTQLKTSRLDSELNLGYLVTQSGYSASRGGFRGEGLEWRSDGWGTLRASSGILFSTQIQPNSNDTALATPALSTQLENAENLAKQISDSANTHHALGVLAKDNIHKLHARVDTNGASVNGHSAQKPDPAGDGRQLKDPVEVLQDSVVVMDSPASLTVVTEGSTVAYASGDLQATSQGDAQLTAQKTLTLQSGNHLSLFTHHGGIKLISAEHDIYVGAHSDTLHIASEQALTITSTDDSILIVAQDAVTLFGDGAQIELKGGDINFISSGEFTVKGNASFAAGSNDAGTPVELPDPILPKDQIELDHRYHDGEGVNGAEYNAKLSDGTERKGKLDASGTATLKDVPMGSAEVTYGPASPGYKVKNPASNPTLGQTQTDSLLNQLNDA